MGEAASAYEVVFRHVRERSEDASVGRNERLRPDCHPAQAALLGPPFALANRAGCEPDVFRENIGKFAIPVRKKRLPGRWASVKSCHIWTY